MKKSKSGIAGLLVLLLLVLLPSAHALAEDWDYWEDDYYGDEYYYEDDSYYYEEDDWEEETEEPIPESYYYPIESNDIEGWPEGPMIEAASAVVMDMDTGTFLYSKQATEKQYPASITKIMTTLLLIENCDLDDTITFSEVVYDLEEGSSHIGIEPGEEMTLRQCAYAIMLASANDAANGVAEYIAGSISGFADMMNEKAAELGCVNTHFSNPHGLYSDDHYTCAYDMALIAQAAYENETFREIVGCKEYTIPETNITEEERSFLNHHQMLNEDSEYYEEWCTGGKTGYTSQCLNTLVTYAEKDGRKLVSVVMRVNGSGKAYLESTDILNYGFDNFYEQKYRESFSGLTFYDIMGLGYVGTAEDLLSPAWQRKPFEKLRVHLTLPNDATQDQITFDVTEEEGSARKFAYFYNGQPVGSASGKLNSPIYPAATALSIGQDQTTTASGGSTQMEGMDELLDQTVDFIDSAYDSFMDFAMDHTWLVLGVCALLIVLLIILIVVLFFRSTADARIRKKRMQEEEEKQKREEEIEQMTTDEIEEELREAMKEEDRRKQEEEDAKADAERAAKEEEEMEWKAQETERLIDELEKERQERIAAAKNENDNSTGE